MSDQIVDNEKTEDEEINLLDLIAVLLKYKWFIVIFTGIAAAGIFLYCLISLKLPPEKTYMPNLYKPKAEMLINDSSTSGGLANALSSSGLGSLAGLAGISAASGPSNSSLAGYFVKSFTVQDAIIDRFLREDIEKKHNEAVEELKKKGKYKPEKDKWVFPLTDTRISLSEKIETSYSSGTGVFTISVEDKDPQLACDIINYTVDLLEQRFTEIGVDKNKLTVKNLEENIATAYKNVLALEKQIQNLDYSVSDPYAAPGKNSVVMDSNMLKLELNVQQQIYSSLKTQYETLKVTMASEQPVFQILEYAEIPDKKSGPSRGKLCIIVTMAAFFVSVFLTFLLNAIQNIKKDPVAMAKLHPGIKGK